MFIDSLKLLLKFNNSSLTESVSQQLMQTVGSDTEVEVLPGGFGYQMKQNQYLEIENLSNGKFQLDVGSDMTIGFWLNPVNHGFVSNPSTDEAEDIQMPIIDLLKNGDNVISIQETSREDGDNHLSININDDEYIASTQSYEEGIWHYFWIVYRGSDINIYIDGSLQTLQNISGTLPASIDISFFELFINNNINGFAYNKTYNAGVIDDLAIFNRSNFSIGDLQRIINNSIEHVADTDFNSFIIFDYGIIFDDPTTIRVNSMIDDMSYIYLARNDGRILRGSPLLWEVRRVFSNPEEENTIKNLSGDNKIENGFLKIANSIIKI